MLCLGFNSGPQKGRQRWIHRALCEHKFLTRSISFVLNINLPFLGIALSTMYLYPRKTLFQFLVFILAATSVTRCWS